MESLATVVSRQFQALSPLELLAVLLAIGYLLLAIRQNIWCWFFAAISTAIYVYLFLQAKLYMESLLNIFYFAMALSTAGISGILAGSGTPSSRYQSGHGPFMRSLWW